MIEIKSNGLMVDKNRPLTTDTATSGICILTNLYYRNKKGNIYITEENWEEQEKVKWVVQEGK